MIGTWGTFASKHNSLSYNMYLFHFPIIQTLFATGIFTSLGDYLTFSIAVLATVVLSIFSWFAIDKRILK